MMSRNQRLGARAARRIAVVCAAAVAIGMLFVASTAQANLSYDTSFGASGTGAGQFTFARGVAVNQATGHVYVTDQALNRVQEFDADGVFIRMWGKGVNQTTLGNICPVTPGDICGPGTAGSGSAEFNAPKGIAVDSGSGAVYVQDGANNRVQKFSSSGQFLLMWGKGVNFDTGGDVCTAASGDVCKLGGTTANSTLGQFSGWTTAVGPSLAVDGGGFVYVGDPLAKPYARVEKFDSAGSFVGQIAAPNGGASSRGLDYVNGLAVDATGTAFVLDQLLAGVKRFPASQFTVDGSTAHYESKINSSVSPLVGPQMVAIDPSNQFLFLGTDEPSCRGTSSPVGFQIREYHPLGQEVECTVLLPTIGKDEEQNWGGMAISATHKLYIADLKTDQIRVFTTPVAVPPTVSAQSVSEITTNHALIKAQVSANYDDTTLHVEYGTSPCSADPDACSSTQESGSIGVASKPVGFSTQLSGLSPNTTYYYRVVASNKTGTTPGPDLSFKTYASPAFLPCPNNLARQQTGAAFLLDCRAYELVSAAFTGGYNVESDLFPGQTPFGGYPLAKDKALYAIHNGGVPNTGNPTNRGPDPYLATRDAANGRWNTTYVGIPADAPSAAPFSSTLAGADAGLENFAFSGSQICNPCFGDGSAGIPLHGPDGGLTQGMVGSIPVAFPVPAGQIAKSFSANGSHFVFGSMQQFELDANSSETDLTIYDRDLETGTTQVVSKLPTGDTIQSGAGVAELDISSDGSRIVIGQVVSTDAAGNRYYHLYMHVGNGPNTIDLTPGAAAGVLYDGMNAAGTMVYFTAKDTLATAANQDSDTGADIYRADVDGSSAVLTRVSTGSDDSGDTDACEPVANSVHDHWNTIGTSADCGVVAVGGGGGVASGSGSIYFLSPEQLDSSDPLRQPVEDAPNLYLARPGSEPRFVATLESALTGPQPPARLYRFQRNFGPAFSRATGIGVDHASGNVYVFDIGAKVVKKFNASGSPVSFTAGSGSGTNQLNGADAPTGAFPLGVSLPVQLAVDQTTGNFYVPDVGHGVIDVFKSTGAYDSQISTPTPAGVAINSSNHNVYVTNNGASTVSVFTAAGAPVISFATISSPTALAVDSAGNVHVANGSQVATYDSSGKFVRVLDPRPSFGVAVDPANDDVFVNEGSRFVQFDSLGGPAAGPNGDGNPVGVGSLSGSVGIAVDAGRIYTSNTGGKSMAEFGLALKPSRFVDNPLVVDSVGAAESRRTGEFQTNASGDDAAFTSLLPLSDFDSAGHYEVFRYDAVGNQLACASCNPTTALPSTDADLASNGLSVTDDGRVFFTTGESLVLRDTDSRDDAYEWEEGGIELISTGTSSFDSRLLSVAADGTDAFFFTHDTLVEGDHNPGLVKLYDARENGGFFIVPPAPSCAASDECHGAGSPAPRVPSINTVTGSGGNCASAGSAAGSSCGTSSSCRKGTVRRGGRCVKKHHRKARHHRKQTHVKQGGGK